jgi:hypothetical protein
MLKLKFDGVSRIIARQGLVLRKNSPHIFFGAGVVGAVGSTVLACRATLKLEETLDNLQVHHNNLQAVKEGLDKGLGTITREEYVKECAAVYTKSAVELTKLYGPAVVVGVAAVACLTGSHVQLHRRNTGLIAAYSALDAAYNKYRERVAQKLGDEAELDIYRGTTTETVKNEMGKPEVVQSIDPNGLSAYAKVFGRSNPNWKDDSEFNRTFLHIAQVYFNNRLHQRGHVFLNEVYDHLGFEHTNEGALLGWVRGGDGDDFIDLGVYEGWNTRAFEGFLNGEERAIIVDFNVDGVIYGKI